ncbi:hypothetical protein HPP92_027468 [Vanilla planifolia]|uniref:Uncharacterized protein n=1 Tax=Vanilla planifolia TaxID=51239 RepID=A0A835U5H9_VANPL|nr:hypothetical protein HPP92_027468 [Vanilla planifolia]
MEKRKIFTNMKFVARVSLRCGCHERELSLQQVHAPVIGSSLRLDLSCVLQQVVSEPITFLWKANRALKQMTLGILSSLLIAYGDQFSSSAYGDQIFLVHSTNTSFDMLLDSLLSCAKPSQRLSILYILLHSVLLSFVLLLVIRNALL